MHNICNTNNSMVNKLIFIKYISLIIIIITVPIKVKSSNLLIIKKKKTTNCL